MKKLINYEVEILPVILGLKPVSNQEISSKDLPFYLKKMKKLGLHVEYIFWQDYIRKKAKYNCFPGKVADNRKKGSVLVYFSKDKKGAILAKKYDCTNQNFKFGRALGYPVCCIRAFKSNFKNSKIKNPLVAHTLCSKNCQATKKYIKEFNKYIKMDL